MKTKHEKLMLIEVKTEGDTLCGHCQFMGKNGLVIWCHLFEQKLNNMWADSAYMARLEDCKNAFAPPIPLIYSQEEDEE